jgi:toxin-antitoxin system PIN domain toxin
VRRGLDTNVLVYAHMPSLPEHGPVRAFVLRALAEPGATLVLTPGVLHEFVHVVTDPRRFEPPISVPEALAVARLYLGRTNVECIATDETALRLALELVERHDLGRKHLADALLAATLLANGVREIVTCDSAGFAAFADLTVIDPRRG